MKITKEEVLHVAHLARLDIDDADVDRFAGQIGTILDYVIPSSRWTPPALPPPPMPSP
jgi:Asp-tRNA(Asn)/Glu-tRNA(Gln) amidotransferase C subunit